MYKIEIKFFYIFTIVKKKSVSVKQSVSKI